MVDNKSVGVYTTKKSKNNLRQKQIDNDAKEVEEICSGSMITAVDSLSSIIPDLRYLLSPVIDTGAQIQKQFNEVVLKQVQNSASGCWNTFLYVDGRTHNLHTEKDCAYTLITVPSQVMNKNLPLVNKPMFLFKIGKKEQIMLPLVNNMSFVYNGKFIMHRQAYTPSNNSYSRKFFNMSSYGNEKLFNHLRRTFDRLREEKLRHKL